MDFKESVVAALPVAITIAMAIFLWFRRKLEVDFREISRIRLIEEDDSKNNNIEKLVVRGDVDLRVLEEVTEIDHHRYFYVGRGKSNKEMILEKIQRELRGVLRNSIDAENFSEIKERVIALLDQVSAELKEIRQKVPFEGLDDRTLLIDRSN